MNTPLFVLLLGAVLALIGHFAVINSEWHKNRIQEDEWKRMLIDSDDFLDAYLEYKQERTGSFELIPAFLHYKRLESGGATEEELRESVASYFEKEQNEAK